MVVYQVYPRRRLLPNLSMNTYLILINVILFVVFSLFISFNYAPIDYIAIKPLNILNGKFLWTFITSMFMHGGIFHLFANMLSLLFIGSFIEKLIGKKR